ncbi:MAG: glycosyltransferase family 2 protein [Actinobacteria bacterium]|nr:glycosyltransferase family 2 protein [Actinomycetota bacterium]
MKITALVAAYNEEDKISFTINALKKIDLINEIILVDDGSTDSTKVKAKASGAGIIAFPKNLGKGEALNRAIKKIEADIIVLVDGDVADSAFEIEKLIAPVLEGKADMTIADFPKAETKGGFGFVKKLSKWGIKKLSDLDVNEPLSGQRVIRQDVLKKVGKFETGFGIETALTIDAARLGFKIIEIPVNMSHSETKRDLPGFIHRGKQFLDVLRVIVKKKFQRKE